MCVHNDKPVGLAMGILSNKTKGGKNKKVSVKINPSLIKYHLKFYTFFVI